MKRQKIPQDRNGLNITRRKRVATLGLWIAAMVICKYGESGLRDGDPYLTRSMHVVIPSLYLPLPHPLPTPVMAPQQKPKSLSTFYQTASSYMSHSIHVPRLNGFTAIYSR